MSQVNWWAKKNDKRVSSTINCMEGEEFSWGEQIRREAERVGADEWEWNTDPKYVPAWWRGLSP